MTKGYRVTKRSGEAPIFRDGVQVGSWPEAGYSVQIFGTCTALAGTELAAHALAEVYREIEPHRRRWVLTEAEYDEHCRILEDDRAALLAQYPYTHAESIAVGESNDRYATVIERGQANIRRKLLNHSPYEYFHWDPNPLKRPDEFPAPAFDEVAATPRM